MTTTATDTIATLAALWASIKDRRTGMFGCLSVREQCAALLSSYSLPEAIAYADRLHPAEGTYGYWEQVADYLRTVRD